MPQTMRFVTAATLLACLVAAGCAGVSFSPNASAPETAAAAPAGAPAPAPVASAVAAPSRSTPSAGGGPSASGGARTAASRPPPEPTEPENDPLTQARVDCWMKVEQQRLVRDIDRRIAFVDKCVAQAMKGQQ